jgi:hypothetical protein
MLSWDRQTEKRIKWVSQYTSKASEMDKVRVKFTLQHARKYRAGEETQIYLPLTSALGCGGDQFHATVALTLGINRYPLWVCAGIGGCGKSHASRDKIHNP